MSRTKKGSKGSGYEYWKSRLHRYGDVPGKETKIITHQRERAVAKRGTTKLVEEAAEEAEQGKDVVQKVLSPPQQARSEYQP